MDLPARPSEDLSRQLSEYPYPGYPPSDLVIFSSPSSVRPVYDAPSHTFRPPSASPLPPRVLIYLIPGNPGLVEFYDSFLARLSIGLGAKGAGCIAVCSGHLGHSLRTNSNLDLRFMRNFNLWKTLRKSPAGRRRPGESLLEEHVDYHSDLLGKLVGEAVCDGEKTKVIVIGHSVGAYIATKVLERHESAVLHVIGLFPTISQIAHSPNGRRLMPLFSPVMLPVLNVVQLIALLVPRILFREVVHLGFHPVPPCGARTRASGFWRKSRAPRPAKPPTRHSSHNQALVIALVLNLNALSAVLRMARSEMAVIGPLDAPLIRAFHKRITLCWTTPGADLWVGEAEVKELIELFERCRVEDESHTNEQGSAPASDAEQITDESNGSQTNQSTQVIHSTRVPQWTRSPEQIPHAFCLEHSDQVADQCIEWIEEILHQNSSPT